MDSVIHLLNNWKANAILGNQASYALAALNPVKRAMAHFLCDPGPINAMISRQKIDFVT